MDIVLRADFFKNVANGICRNTSRGLISGQKILHIQAMLYSCTRHE